MASDLPEQSLVDLCSAVVDCPHSTPIWTESGFIVLRNQDIKGGRLDLSSPSFTDETHYLARIKRAAPTAGDIVITREAPMGDVCLIPDGLRCCLGQRQVLLRPNAKRVVGRYLLFALQSDYVQHQIGWNEGTGSTVSNLRIPVLERLKIPAPSLPEQHAIAHILGTLDDKIELNRRSNATLEAMARVLFKDWFVDFGPVRAKLEGRQPYLAPELWPLFPEELDEQGLPREWRTARISDLALIKGGKQLHASQITNAGYIPVFGGAGPMGFTSGHNADGLVITFGRVGAYCGQFFWHQGKAWINNNASLVVPHASTDAEWLFFGISSLDLDPIKRGAAQPFVSNGDMAALEITLPPDKIREVFRNFVAPVFGKIQTNLDEIKALKSLHGILLQKLLSGELRVRDAERQVETAL